MNLKRKQTFSTMFEQIFNKSKPSNDMLFQQKNLDSEQNCQRSFQGNEVTKKKMSSVQNLIKQAGTMTIKDNLNGKSDKQDRRNLRNTFKKETELNKQTIKSQDQAELAGHMVVKACSQDQKIILCSFFCGCGYFTNEKDQIKAHIKQIHNQNYITGSSHALTLCDNLVFAWPLQTQVPNNYKLLVKDQPYFKLSYLQYHESKSEQKPKVNKKVKKDKKAKQKSRIHENLIEQLPFDFRKEQQTVNPKIGSIQTKNDQLQHDKKNEIKNISQLNQLKVQNKSQNYIYSQQTKNVINSHTQNYVCLENQLYKKNNGKKKYKCGKCQVQYEREFFFKKHIIFMCRILNHEGSSHHLIKKDQTNWNFTQNIITPVIQKFTQQSVQKSMQITNSQYWQFTLQNQESLNQENQQAFCGNCQKIFPHSKGYHFHIFNKHFGIVPDNSSHILIRIIRNNIKEYLVMSIKNNSEVFSSIKYYCPCKLQREMSRQVFVNHVIKRHKGKTPFMKMAGPGR